MTDLQGRELDEACLLVLHPNAICETNTYGRRQYHIDGEGWGSVPEFHASVDASLRDLWPECQRRGFVAWGIDADGDSADAYLVPADGGPIYGHNLSSDPVATALARACYAALTEVRE